MPAPSLKRKSTNESSTSSKRVRVEGDSTAPAPFPAGPGGPMEIVFSFDTTGSMSSCLVQVRKNLTDMINRLQKDIPGLRMAVFAHGDYCDAHNYVTKYVDFTNDVTKLVDFVNNVSSTGGGDADECYELVLHEVRTKLSWSAGTQRSLVMIGDANPHGPEYAMNTLKLDWKKVTDQLAAEGVHIYGVNCARTPTSCEDFYKSLASKTDGKYLELKDWNNIFDMMMAICYREHGVEFFKAYEHEVRSRGPVVSREMDVMLKALRHGDDDGGYGSDDGDDGTGTTSVLTTPPPTPTTTPKRKAVSPVKKHPVPKKPKATKRAVVRKVTASTLTKTYRERFGKHPFTSLDWSRWQRLITKSKPNNRLAKNWIPTRNDVTGFRRIGLFKADAHKPAFYEVGVKLPKSQKIYATFFRVTNGFKTAGHIDTCMFKSGHLTTQINDVITKGCDVYIRRADLPANVDIDGTRLVGVTEVRDFIKTKVEYAWNKGVYGRRRHRLIVKKDIQISSDKL